MCARLISSEEALVDPSLGYPPGFAKLCRNAHKQMRGLITPYTDGPPQCFFPYARLEEEEAKVKEFDVLFRIVPEEERDSPNARKHADVLWQQLDHLGNAGFDPAKFRVDPYGNVVYYHADAGSPLAWEVDHWFPHSRGGRTTVANLRIIQWQVNQRKKDRLEFLVPWWDLQLGVSVNQFLSAFTSKNADFRTRFFSYLFLQGEKEPIGVRSDVSSHVWPASFREKRSQLGLAPASLTKSDREADIRCSDLRPIQTPAPVTPGTGARRRWSVGEEEGLRRALQKFGPGNWKEIKEFEPALANRSTVQIKDKYRLMKGDWNVDKENCTAGRESAVGTAVHKEIQMKAMREEEKRAKHMDIARLEQNLKDLQEENHREEKILQELEDILRDHRDEVQKQRRWAETQSLYKQSLERMIRDSLHQSTVYKEQARLNQAACNVLIAKLDAVKAECKAAEQELLLGFKHWKGLQEVARGPSPRKGGDVVDVSSCLVEPLDVHHGESLNVNHSEPLEVYHREPLDVHHVAPLDVQPLNVHHRIPLNVTHGEPSEGELSEVYRREPVDVHDVAPLDVQPLNVHHRETLNVQNSGSKAKEELPDEQRGAAELQVVVVGYEYQHTNTPDRTSDQEEQYEHEPDHKRIMGRVAEFRSDDHHEAVRYVQDRTGECSDAESIRGSDDVGPLKVDQWLSSDRLNTEGYEKAWTPPRKSSAEKPRGLIGGLLKRLNFKQQLNAKIAGEKRGAGTPDRKNNGTPDSKEFVDLAVKMGEISLEDQGVAVTSDRAEPGSRTEIGLHVESSEMALEERRTSSATTSFEDAVSGSPAPETPKKSPFRTLHEAEVEPEVESGARPSNFSEHWDEVSGHARSGIKQSFKICSQAWNKAMKKLESQIQDVQPQP